jgi:hypothetical protein
MAEMDEAGRKRLSRRLLGSCAIFLIFAAGAWFVVAHFLSAVADPPRDFFAWPATFFLALGAFSFWGLLTGGGNSSHSLKALIRRAESGGSVTDGEPILCSGTVRAEREVLHAPISGTPCVAYFYVMYYWGRQFGATRQVQRVPVYWGTASVPFAVEGVMERRRILAVPRLEIAPKLLESDDARRAARAWVESTSFKDEANATLGSVKAAFTISGEMLTDDDGATRHDWRLAGVSRDVSDLNLEEIVVPVGGQAAVCGTWSESRGAIVSGDGLNGVLGVAVSLGGPASMPDDAVANKGIVTYLVTATGLTLIGAGLVWLARHLFAH